MGDTGWVVRSKDAGKAAGGGCGQGGASQLRCRSARRRLVADLGIIGLLCAQLVRPLLLLLLQPLRRGLLLRSGSERRRQNGVSAGMARRPCLHGQALPVDLVGFIDTPLRRLHGVCRSVLALPPPLGAVPGSARRASTPRRRIKRWVPGAARRPPVRA